MAQPDGYVPPAAYERPWITSYQEVLFGPERYVWVEGYPKAGKTQPCLYWQVEQICVGAGARPGCNHWWASPSREQARDCYDRMKHALRPWFESGDAEPHDTEKRISFAWGPDWWFKHAEKPDLLYGRDVWSLVCDEASRWREASWIAASSTLDATRGPIRLIGNVRGRGWFYRACRRAEAGLEDHRFAAFRVADGIREGITTQAQIDDARRRLEGHPEAFAELYEGRPSDDAGNPFGLANIAACTMPDASITIPGEHQWSSGAPVVAWGWDIGDVDDWMWGIGLDPEMRACRSVRFRHIDTAEERIWDHTGEVPALIDRTGLGRAVVANLQARAQRERPASRDGETNFRGIDFTGKSKPALIGGLRVAMHRREPRFPDGLLRAEMEAFEVEYTETGPKYSAPAGLKDDGVCALALARDEWATVIDRWRNPPAFVARASRVREEQPFGY